MQIKGIEGMTAGQLDDELQRGAKFVIYSYAMSFLVVTLRRSSDVYFVKAGESAVARGLPYTFLSLLLGWWGFPWGFIYTPMALVQNLGGGRDVTAEVRHSLLSGS